MARYVLGKDVWEIEQVANELRIVASKKPSVRKFGTSEQAAAMATKLIAEKEAVGYALGGAVVEHRNRDLEAAIADEPELAESYVPYADWLQSRGDPRGELISMQIAAETDESIAARAERWIKKHDLLGALAKHRKNARAGAELVTWRFGFIHRANVNALDHAKVVELLEQVLTHASGRLLVELRLILPSENAQPVVDVLARHAPASLRRIKMSQARPSRARVDLSALWARVPKLRQLDLNCRIRAIGAIDLQHLEQLRIGDQAFSTDAMTDLSRARWPALQRIDIDLVGGLRRPGDDTTVAVLLEMLGRPELVVKHLSASSADLDESFVEALAACPLAATLETLDLSYNQVSDRQRGKFPRLEQFRITERL
jgi:uncharacterized protein (TIGR02996 family)